MYLSGQSLLERLPEKLLIHTNKSRPADTLFALMFTSRKLVHPAENVLYKCVSEVFLRLQFPRRYTL